MHQPEKIHSAEIIGGIPSIGGLCVGLCLLLTSVSLSGCFTLVGPDDTRAFYLDAHSDRSIELEPIDIEHYESKYSGFDGVYLNREFVTDFFSTPSASVLESRLMIYRVAHITTSRRLVLDPDNSEVATFRLKLWPDETLSKARITLISPDGSTQRFDEDDLIMDEEGNGRTIYRLAYPGVERGMIIDEGYEVLETVDDRYWFRSIPLQYSLPCERLTVLYAYPTHWDVGFEISGIDKETQLERVSRTRDRTLDRVLARYSATDLDAGGPEAYAPYFSETFPILHVSLQRFYSGFTSRSFKIDTWKEYSRTVNRMVLGYFPPDPDTFDDDIEEIAPADLPPTERMRKIVAWVQDNIEIDDEGPYALTAIFREKRGSIFRVVGLTERLLRQAGIEPDIVMIRPVGAGSPPETFILPGSFPVPALRATEGDSTYYLFPWMQKYPVDRIPLPMQGQLVLNASDGRKSGTIDTVPMLENGLQRTDVSYAATIDEEGGIRMEETWSFHGDQAFPIRREIRDLDEEEQTDYFWEMMTYDGGETERIELEIENRENYSAPLVVRLVYSVDNLVTITPDEVIVQTTELFEAADRTIVKVDLSKRRHPIRIYYDETKTKEVSISWPSTWRLETPIDKLERATRFGEVRTDVNSEPGTVTARYERTLLRSEGEPSEVSDLFRIIGVSAELSIPNLVFSR